MAASEGEGGCVYVLTNDGMEGMVKIGFTTRSAEVRARELSTTGVPMPFAVAFESERTRFFREIERAVHARLKDKRVRQGREFFRCTADEAIRVVGEEMGKKKGGGGAPPGARKVVDVEVGEGVAEIVLRIRRVGLGV